MRGLTPHTRELTPFFQDGQSTRTRAPPSTYLGTDVNFFAVKKANTQRKYNKQGSKAIGNENPVKRGLQPLITQIRVLDPRLYFGCKSGP